MLYREESYINDHFVEKESLVDGNSQKQTVHSRSKNGMKLIDKTHINDVFDTSTVEVPEGAPSPGKSAITRHRDSSCSDLEIKKLKEAMFNDVHDRSGIEEDNGAVAEYEDYTPQTRKNRDILSEGA